MARSAERAHHAAIVNPSRRSGSEPGAFVSLLLVVFSPEIRAWFGQAPLARVFWLHGVLGSALLAGLFLLAAWAGRQDWVQLLLLVLVGYSAWLLPSIWRCAERALPPWQQIARCLTVAWAANAALLGLFLEIWIVSGGAGG